jgi:hypothetical protein
MTYDWKADFANSYDLACHMMALRTGSLRFDSPWEMYWLESQGLIP